MRMETPIARVRGLGPAKHGAEDWWKVRLNSVTTLALFVWLLVSLLTLPNLDHPTMVEWLRQPVNAVLMLLLIASTFWHSKFGVREWIDDYVHDEGMKFAAVALSTILHLVVGAIAAFSVLKIAFAGGA